MDTQQQQQQILPHDVEACRGEVDTATNESIQEGQGIEEGDETITTKEYIQNQQLRQLEHNISPPTSSKEFHENELVSSTIWKESEYNNNQERNDQRSRQTITKVTTKQRSEETNVNDNNYSNYYNNNCQTVMIDDDANGNEDDYSSFVAVELDLPLEELEMTTISPMTTTTTTTTTAKKIICQSTHLTTTVTAPTTTPDDETIYDNSLLLFDMNENEVERGEEEEEEELVLTSNVPPPPPRQRVLHHPLLSVMKNVPWDKLLMVSTGTCDLFFNCKYSARQVEDEVRAEEEREEKGSSYIHDEWEEEGSDGCQQQQQQQQQREKDGYVPISLGHEYNELDQECHHHHHGDNHYEREEGECFNNIHTEEFENLGLDYNSSMLDEDDDDDEVNEDDDGGC